MSKAYILYISCLEFWQRMGVQKEDNCMALSMLDVVNAKPAGWEEYNIHYYIERGKRLLDELRLKKYDDKRGSAGWIEGKGF